jgi:hypothetical protein
MLYVIAFIYSLYMLFTYTDISPCFALMAKTTKKAKPTNPKEVQVKLGAKIRQLRKAKGYTSALKFAIDYEFSHVQMARWEKGANLRLDTLIRLADAFDISLEELFKEL